MPHRMGKKVIDIHNYDASLRRERELLQESALSARDKTVISDYCRMLFLSSISKPRIQKEMTTLRMFAIRLASDLRNATSDQLKKALESIREEPRYSVYTKRDYARIVRKFYRWLEYGDAWATKEVPERVAWIHANVKKKDQPRLQRADMLTEDEAHRLIDAAETARDKALLAILWDTGARIGEIGGLTVGSVTFADAGTFIDMNGKTGQRTPFVIECTPHLIHWLGLHPARDTPGAPLWLASQNGIHDPQQPMCYNAFVKAIHRCFERAKVKKHYNPHLFRHSRATWAATNGWTQLEMCKFFGWTPESDMPAYYTSLVNEDVEARMRKCYGLENKRDDATQKRKPHTCQRCQAVNGADQRYCYRCGMALTMQAASEAMERRERGDELLNTLVQNPEGLKELLATLHKHGLLAHASRP